jgi:hypothetical protein
MGDFANDVPSKEIYQRVARLAVGLEPLNALDAAHRSPRSARFLRAKIGFTVGPATRRPIKRNKELTKLSNCFPRVLKLKLLRSFMSGHVDLDEWDAGFRQTKSNTPVPPHYGLPIYLRVVFWKRLQGPYLASYRLW